MKIFLFVLVALAIVLGYYGAATYAKYRVSKALVAKAEPFENRSENRSTTLLVLGDSTAVGVGAEKPEDTIAALYAESINATYVENQAVSGARVEDLPLQIAAIKFESYDHVLIQIGANDIIRFQSAEKSAQSLAKVLESLPEHASLKLLTAGNVGGTEFFPWFLNPFYHRLTLRYHEAFAPVVAVVGGEYINLYEPPETDIIHKEPEKYLAADGLHLSSAGYKVWFEKIVSER